MKNKPAGIFSISISKEQAKDSGMAVVLILLITGLITGIDLYFLLAAGALLIDMVFPMLYYPFAIFWFGLSKILGAIASRVLLTLVYLFIVLPVALLRRLSGKDTLLLKQFKKSTNSVMRTRNHVFEARDLEKPF